VLLTRAAYAAAVEWTREGSWQSEDARFWDVLNVIRHTARQVAGDLIPRETYVLRVPNTTPSGKPSTATTASRQRLRVSIEGYNLTGQACIIIALPGEDCRPADIRPNRDAGCPRTVRTGPIPVEPVRARRSHPWSYYSNMPRPRDPWRVRPWGRVDYPAFSAPQFGRGTIRLIIFRPGTTAAARRWADAWASLVYREMGILAVGPAILAMFAFPNEFPFVLRASIVAAVLLTAAITIWAKARPTLSDARGVLIFGRAPKRRGEAATITGDLALFEQALAKLDELDDLTNLPPPSTRHTGPRSTTG
jgi:hypothetical protein